MRLSEIDGDDFFDPQEMQRARNQGSGSRSILIWMNPADFLDMALEGFEQGKLDRIDQAIRDKAKLQDLPFLGFVHDGQGNAQVIAHEGRHRARALMAKGVTRMPVVLRAIEGGGQTIRWDRVNDPENFSYFRETWPNVLHSEDGRCTIPFPVQRQTL